MYKTANGQYLTIGMFFETAEVRNTSTIFTLKDEDLEKNGKTYKSLRLLYMTYNHIPHSEYDFANECLGGWRHWLKMQESPQLKHHIEAWREEMEVKLRANAVKEVISTSTTEKGFQAAKWIAEGGYAPKKAGRPSKEMVERERRIAAGIKDEVDDAWDRIQQ